MAHNKKGLEDRIGVRNEPGISKENLDRGGGLLGLLVKQYRVTLPYPCLGRGIIYEKSLDIHSSYLSERFGRQIGGIKGFPS